MNDVSKPNESSPQQPDPSPTAEPANPGTSQLKQLLRCVATGKQASEAAYLALKAELKVIAEQQMKPADHLSLWCRIKTFLAPQRRDSGLGPGYARNPKDYGNCDSPSFNRGAAIFLSHIFL